MTSKQHPAMVAILVIGSLLLGCSAETPEAAAGLSVYGLTESRTFAACTEQVLNAVSNNASNSSMTFTWNVTAPSGAAFSATPNDDELRFVARSPGEYLITVAENDANSANPSNCEVDEFEVTVDIGVDANNNGIGDICESTNWSVHRDHVAWSQLEWSRCWRSGVAQEENRLGYVEVVSGVSPI